MKKTIEEIKNTKTCIDCDSPDLVPRKVLCYECREKLGFRQLDEELELIEKLHDSEYFILKTQLGEMKVFNSYTTNLSMWTNATIDLYKGDKLIGSLTVNDRVFFKMLKECV